MSRKKGNDLFDSQVLNDYDSMFSVWQGSSISSESKSYGRLLDSHLDLNSGLARENF